MSSRRNKYWPIIWDNLPLLFLALFVAWVAWLRYTKEPSYKDVPLSTWLRYFYYPENDERRTNAIVAVQEIGVDAIPYLIKQIERSRPRYLKVIDTWRSKYFDIPPPVDHLRSRLTAVEGFEVLGTNGESAIPQLSKLLFTPPFNSAAGEALGAIGNKSLSVLVPASTNDNAQVRYGALGGLSRLPTNTAAVLPIVIRSTHDSNFEVRALATLMLHQFANSSTAIPLLVTGLRDTNEIVRMSAARLLGEYGTNAFSAVPALQAAKNDSNGYVQFCARVSLSKIAPDSQE